MSSKLTSPGSCMWRERLATKAAGSSTRVASVAIAAARRAIGVALDRTCVISSSSSPNSSR